jgi:hypothetical protein
VKGGRGSSARAIKSVIDAWLPAPVSFRGSSLSLVVVVVVVDRVKLCF